MATSSQTKRRSWASQARPVVAALSGACLTLGLSIANLQAGRFATTAVSFAVSTFIGLVLGGVMSRIAAPRLRQALMLATMVGAGAALVVANAPNAQAQDNACAVRVNIAGNQLTANPTGNMIGSTDRPLRLELEAGSIDALINTGRRFDTVVMRARPLRPLGGAEINFDGQALRLDGTQAAASLRVASQGGDLRLIVDDRDYPAPPGVINLFGEFRIDDSPDSCTFSIFVRFVAPAVRTRTGQAGLALSAIGVAGLAGTTLMEPRRTRSNQPVRPPSRPAGSAGPTVKTPRAPELIEKQAKRDHDFVPNPDFAITALGSPNDNPSDRKVFAEVEVNRRPRRGFMADTRNDFYVWVDAGSPSAFAVPSSAALDELDRGIWLDVVFHLGDLTKRDELFVPAELGQRSDSICFSFDLPSNAEIDGTMIFWNRRTGQAWEVVAVLGSATPNGDSPFEMISIERDRRATAVRDRNDVHSAPEVIGLINIDGDLLRFHTQSQQMFSARGVEEWGVDIGDDLHALQLAFPRAIHEWTNPQVVEILASIARVGATLRTAVIGDHAAAPTDEHIQLINTNQVNHLPIEFLYDHPAPTGDGVQILQSCIAALADPAIVRCSCPPEGRDDVVCPFGFWGVAKVVERLEASRDRVNRHARAVPDRFLPAPATTLFGVSNRIAGDAVIDLRDALSGPGAVIDVRQAGDWDAWRSNVQQDPVEDLLLALPHQASMSLELGGTHIAYSDDLAQVIGDSDRILALLGCNTVDALRGELKSFGLRFLESGASVVIGSVATLNATYAPTVAALLVDELRDGAQNGHRFGQVMRQSRQRLFAAGYPIALALVAVGDAGWAFEPANPVSPEPITF